MAKINVSKNEKYELIAIQASEIYIRQSKDHLPSGLYYLVLEKSYLEEKKIQELISAIQHLRKLIIIFHKDYSAKPTAKSQLINTVPSMTSPTKLLAIKQKRDGLAKANSPNKHAKKNRASEPLFFCWSLWLPYKKISFSYLPLFSIFLLAFSILLGDFFYRQTINQSFGFLLSFLMKSLGVFLLSFGFFSAQPLRLIC